MYDKIYPTRNLWLALELEVKHQILGNAMHQNKIVFVELLTRTISIFWCTAHLLLFLLSLSRGKCTWISSNPSSEQNWSMASRRLRGQTAK